MKNRLQMLIPSCVSRVRANLNKLHRVTIRRGIRLGCMALLSAVCAPLLSAAPITIKGKTFIEWNYDFGDNGVDLRGRLYVPPAAISNPNQKFPLVIFLHGSGGVGTNNTSQLEDGNIQIDGGLNDQAGTREFFLYAPQHTDVTSSFNDEILWPAMCAVQSAAAHYNIDPTRIYVTGFSFGGGGVRNFLALYPDKAGASLIICGVGHSWTAAEAAPQVGKAIWMWHGEDDTSNYQVHVDRSREHVNAILDQAGLPLLPNPLTYVSGTAFYEWGKLRYTELLDRGHNIWNDVYTNNAVWDWLLAQQSDLNASSLPQGETINFDFGESFEASGRFATDSSGRVWNLLNSWGHPNTLSGLVPFARTTSGTITAVSLSLKKKFQGPIVEGSGWGRTGYEDKYVTDGWSASGSGAILCVRGLIPGETYSVEIYASHKSEAGAQSLYKISGTGISTQTQTLDAYDNNSDAVATFSSVAADSRGGFELEILPDTASGGTVGLINTLSITRSGTTPPANNAPVVNAGSDLIISGTSVSIHGTASDDGLPNGTLDISWSKLSGPGSVTFSPIDEAETVATFAVSGTYVLQLSADDGALSSSDTVTVTVSLPSPPVGGTLFFQDFESSTSVGGYVSSGSAGPNMLNDTSPQSGTNAWSIEGGKLKVTHSSASVSPGFARYTDLPGDPKFVLLEFDFTMSNFSTWSAAGLIYLGNFSSTPDYTGNWFGTSSVSAKVEIKGYGTSGYNILVSGTEHQTGLIANPAQEKTISIYINKTGSTQTYTGPDNVSGRTLPDNSISVFVAGELRLENVEIVPSQATSTNLTDFFMFFRQDGTYTIDNLRFVDLIAAGAGSGGEEEPDAYDLTSAGLDGVDIGAGSGGSSRILAGGVDWRVDGSGTGLSGTADSFHFEECGVTGDFVMVTRMKSLTSTSPLARAGLMLRDSSTVAGARMVALATTTGTQYRVAKRLTSGGTATESTPSESYSYPDAWLMLERVGLTFLEVDSTTLGGAPAEVFAGLFATSGSSGVTASSVLSDFDLYDSNVMLKMNFESSGTASSYFSSTPTVNQLDHLHSPAGAAWTIDNGKLKLVHSGTSKVGFTRHTNLVSGTNPAPRFVAMEFDISCQTSTSWSFPINISFGQLSGAGPYGGQLSNGTWLHV
jgi:predicted esterase